MNEIPYSIRRSERARRVRLSVDPEDGVEVVLPRRAPARDAGEAVRELAPWIERRLHAFAQARAELGSREGEVPYLGESLALTPEAGRRRVTRRGGELLVPSDDYRPAVEGWYRCRARAEVAPRLDRACALAGTGYTGLTIRAQRTRWASCSPTGAMSFNWRLLLAPAGVLDSVVWHEVCHLEIADHSPHFWALLERRFPDYRRHQCWLRRYGALLRL